MPRRRPRQDYPADKIEIVLSTRGSTDRTFEIAERFGVDQVVHNPRRTAEAGKAVGIPASSGELILSIDSDNIIVGADWISRMVAPFENPEVISTRGLRWHYRREDHYINRYRH